MMLKLDNIQAYYGKSHVLNGVSLEVQKGEFVTLLGRNGAGKTTSLKTIMGLLPIQSGSITYNEKSLLQTPTHQIYHLGIGYVPQGRHIFSTLSVDENLRLASFKKAEKNIEWVLEYFPRLRERLGHMGNELSGGEQQMLAIARVLICKPELILLDEPSEGIAPLLVKSIMDTLIALNKTGLTILLVDANLKIAASVGTRHYIMSNGSIAREANSREIMEDEELQKKYFKL
jgi:branched-chain amino acid transport system ATP-binding protein